MIKKALCLVAWITNWVIFSVAVVACLFSSYIENWFLSNKIWIYGANIIFLLVCILVGTVFWGLDLDKLLQKYEDTPPSKIERKVAYVIIQIIKIVVIASLLICFCTSVLGFDLPKTINVRFVEFLAFSLLNLIVGLALMRVSWNARRSNQSILKKINPE